MRAPQSCAVDEAGTDGGVELPRRLTPDGEPRWSQSTKVLVVGSGIAGLMTALHASELGYRVTIVTKGEIDDGSTRWAQGGIVAVLGSHDSPAAHADDTLVAGAGICDPAAVDVLTTEGPSRVLELVRLGARFDRDPDGRWALTREGGHHARRIIHAGGDATGAELQRAAQRAVLRDPSITVVTHALALDLLTDAAGHAAGVTVHVAGTGARAGVGAVLARATVLATGGVGQVYDATTNPPVATGDGLALALRAGAVATDVEFLQFHPTVLALDGADPRQQGLVTEAVRGEGAHLVDHDGRRFMPGVHELAELAPRDVVAKAVLRTMVAADTDHVFLDARHLGSRLLETRFPTVTALCRQAGLDPADQLIPVAPKAHHHSGGVRTDLWGRTSIPGLYAVGEVACTGVHGANRLASNSLLEALVYAGRIAADLANGLPPQREPASSGAVAWAVDPAVRTDLQHAMSHGAGVARSAASLSTAARRIAHQSRTRSSGREAWETTNLITVAAALVRAAQLRRETRGCHWREDFDAPDEAWRGHLTATLRTDGTLHHAFHRS